MVRTNLYPPNPKGLAPPSIYKHPEHGSGGDFALCGSHLHWLTTPPGACTSKLRSSPCLPGTLPHLYMTVWYAQCSATAFAPRPNPLKTVLFDGKNIYRLISIDDFPLALHLNFCWFEHYCSMVVSALSNWVLPPLLFGQQPLVVLLICCYAKVHSPRIRTLMNWTIPHWFLHLL